MLADGPPVAAPTAAGAATAARASIGERRCEPRDRRVLVDLLDRHLRQIAPPADQGAERAITSESAPSSSKTCPSTETSSAPSTSPRSSAKARSVPAAGAAGAAGGFEDRAHRLTEVAARMSPPATSQRPANERQVRVIPRAPTLTRAEYVSRRAGTRGDIAKLEPPPRRREPRLEHRLLNAEQDPVPVHAGFRVEQRPQPHTLPVPNHQSTPSAGSASCGSASIPIPASSPDRATAAAR